MDDIVRTIKVDLIKFTLEVEHNKRLSFLHMCIEHNNLSSPWYCKPTDTRLVLNFHALTPKQYKGSVVQGFVFRIHKSCNPWESLYENLSKVKEVLQGKQYLPGFYDPIISSTVGKIITFDNYNETTSTNTSTQPKVNLVWQHRGVPKENLTKKLKRSIAPVQPILTRQKKKMYLPTLKPVVKKTTPKSCIIYINMSRILSLLCLPNQPVCNNPI